MNKYHKSDSYGNIYVYDYAKNINKYTYESATT